MKQKFREERVRRFLAGRFMGRYKYGTKRIYNLAYDDTSSFVRCEPNDPEAVLEVYKIAVDAWEVKVNYRSLNVDENHGSTAERFFKKTLDRLINHGTTLIWMIVVEAFNPQRFMEQDTRRQFVGTHRYMNHDYQITKVRFQHLVSEDDRPYVSRRNVPMNVSNTFRIQVDIKMKDWRGDRTRLCEKVGERVRDYVKKTHLPKGNVEVSVRLLKT